MTSAALIIKKLGGTRKAAALLQRPRSTVQSWKEVGVIPARRQQEVLDKARHAGIEINPADFFSGTEVG